MFTATGTVAKQSQSAGDMDEAASSSLLRKVGPDEVFNLPLYEHHLVIDIRPSQEYSRGHMATAVSFPCLPLECVAC